MAKVLDLNYFKRILDIDLDDTTYDTDLDYLLSSAEIYAETELEIKLVPTDITYKIIGNDSQFMYLPNMPLNELYSVKYSSINDDEEYIDISDKVKIYSSAFSCIIYPDQFKYYNYYLINCNVGFNEVPKDLEYALYSLAERMFALKEMQKSGVVRMSTPDGSFTYSYSLLPDSVKAIFDRYRRYSV